MIWKCKNCEFMAIDNTKNCALCGKNDWEDYDLYQMKQISHDHSFIDAMLKLREDDPIEYQLKMQQIRLQIQQQRQIASAKLNNLIPHCPTCNSSNIKKISGLSKAGAVVLWGEFSRKVNKKWLCNCGGSEW